jgi:Icc-related predicted phosphoesterase
MARDEYAAAAGDPLRRTGLFQEEASARLSSWLALAEERLAGTGVRPYPAGGNDDDPAVLRVLEGHDGSHAVPCEGRLFALDGRHTVITVGWSTETPRSTPREASEEEIAGMIEREAAKVPDLSGGSSAVRAAIRRHQPVVGLDGHIHESAAASGLVERSASTRAASTRRACCRDGSSRCGTGS